MTDSKLALKIEKLNKYFSSREDIAMAFLFGSFAKGMQTSESDADIAIYFWPESKELEWENNALYPGEDEIWSAVEKIMEVKTDLVVLNREPATLAFSAIQEGIPIIVKDRSLFLRFLLTISSASEDFREYVKDFWKIKQRS